MHALLQSAGVVVVVVAVVVEVVVVVVVVVVHCFSLHVHKMQSREHEFHWFYVLKKKNIVFSNIL